jgi:hypothetical protein
MPPRTTLADRARKSRIREREYRQLHIKMRQLENITEDQVAALKKIKAAEVKGKPVKATSVDGWEALRDMGAVKEQEGSLVLTGVGSAVVSTDGK